MPYRLFRCALTPPPATSFCETSPHQSLRNSLAACQVSATVSSKKDFGRGFPIETFFRTIVNKIGNYIYKLL